MILVDTSVWVDHLRRSDTRLQHLLTQGAVTQHPWVTAELALGRLSSSGEVLLLLQRLPAAEVATDAELLHFIDADSLSGAGIGLVDVALLAACRLTPGTSLWTRDKRLHAVALRLDMAAATG